MKKLLTLLGVTALAAATFAAPAQAAGETVNVWLTTTSDSGGRTVTRGLQQQTPVTFASGTGSGGVTINVNENTTYQQFEGGGASFTDTAAWLLNSSGALSQATRDDTMRKLFDPNTGIGLSFIRNPLGASDLARYSYTFDDMPAGQTDPNLTHFSIAHDQADVLPLTKQAKQLNPQAKVMASPWSAPPWMKDNDSYLLGWVQSQYYPAYAQYFVKYLQAYQAAGVPIDYVSMQNEPTCCSSYPSTNWNGAGLAYFAEEQPAAGPAARRTVHKGPRARLELGHLRLLRRPDRGRRGDPQRPELRRRGLARLRRRRRAADHDAQPVPEHRRVRHRALRRHLDRATSRTRT